MRFQKILAVLLVGCLCFLSACAPVVSEETVAETTTVYATFYPIYALADMLIDNVSAFSLSCLVQPQDGCLRAYSLSDWDIYLIAYTADAVLAGGNGLESFEDTLYLFGDSGPAIITATYGLSLYNEDDTTEQSDEETSHLVGANPHLYMSVAGAKEMLTNIANALANLNPDASGTIGQNLETARASLDALWTEMAETVGDRADQRVILMNEALIYLAEDFGFTVASWYDRESGYGLYGTDLENCLSSLEESGAKVVLIEKQAPDQLVLALTQAGFSVARIDILSTGREDMGAQGYFDAQRANAQAIAEAFERAEEET